MPYFRQSLSRLLLAPSVPLLVSLSSTLQRITLPSLRLLPYDIENRHRNETSWRTTSVTRHFFNGFIRLHILYHAVKEPIYGAEITEELVRHGYRLSQGTLYPTLHQLEQLGYLRSCTEVVQRKAAEVLPWHALRAQGPG